MNPMTLAVAGVAAAAIFLIAIGIATSGRGSGVSARLERYAAGRDTKAGATAGGLGEIISQSVALAQLNRVVEQRDFGANLARDIARADLRLKPSEFLAIWAGSIVGVPFLFGMRMSRRRTSIFAPGTRSMTSSPSPASPAISICGSSTRRARRPWRMRS